MVIGIFLGIIAAIFFGDLWIKNYIERTYKEGETKQKCNGKILIRKHYNRGMALNLGENKRKAVVVLSVLMTIMAVIVFVVSLGNKGNHMLRTGISLLLGGAFSNTYDRLKRKYVVDYISFNIPLKGTFWRKLSGIVFNISDFCIIIGAVLAAIGANE